MPNRTRIVLSLALLLAAALIALPAAPARSQGPSTTPTPAESPEPRILYSQGNDGTLIYMMMNADGSNKQPVAETFFADNQQWITGTGASFSPDGRFLAFAGVNGAEDVSLSDMSIRLLDLNTNVVTRLVTGDYESNQPVWSPDGSSIAYLVSGELNAVEVVTGQVRPMLGGRVLHNLLGTVGVVSGYDWSPDGNQLAADAALVGGPDGGGVTTIFVMNSDGSELHQVLPMEIYAQYPAWGPEGNNLYYTCDPSGVLDTIEICAIDLATSQTTQVTHLNDTLDILNITDLDVSADGQIIFVLRLEELDAPIDIYRYDPTTGDLVNLTADLDVDVYAPRWVESPHAGP